MNGFKCLHASSVWPVSIDFELFRCFVEGLTEAEAVTAAAEHLEATFPRRWAAAAAAVSLAGGGPSTIASGSRLCVETNSASFANPQESFDGLHAHRDRHRRRTSKRESLPVAPSGKPSTPLGVDDSAGYPTTMLHNTADAGMVTGGGDASRLERVAGGRVAETAVTDEDHLPISRYVPEEPLPELREGVESDDGLESMAAGDTAGASARVQAEEEAAVSRELEHHWDPKRLSTVKLQSSGSNAVKNADASGGDRSDTSGDTALQRHLHLTKTGSSMQGTEKKHRSEASRRGNHHHPSSHSRSRTGKAHNVCEAVGYDLATTARARGSLAFSSTAGGGGLVEDLMEHFYASFLSGAMQGSFALGSGKEENGTSGSHLPSRANSSLAGDSMFLLREEVRGQYTLFQMLRAEEFDAPYAFLDSQWQPITVRDRRRLIEMYYSVDEVLLQRWFGDRLWRLDYNEADYTFAATRFSSDDADARAETVWIAYREGSVRRQWENLKNVCGLVTSAYRGKEELYISPSTQVTTAVQQCFGVSRRLAVHYATAVFSYEHRLRCKCFARLDFCSCTTLCDLIGSLWCDETCLMLSRGFCERLAQIGKLLDENRVLSELHMIIFGETLRPRWQVQLDEMHKVITTTNTSSTAAVNSSGHCGSPAGSTALSMPGMSGGSVGGAPAAVAAGSPSACEGSASSGARGEGRCVVCESPLVQMEPISTGARGASQGTVSLPFRSSNVLKAPMTVNMATSLLPRNTSRHTIQSPVLPGVAHSPRLGIAEVTPCSQAAASLTSAASSSSLTGAPSEDLCITDTERELGATVSNVAASPAVGTRSGDFSALCANGTFSRRFLLEFGHFMKVVWRAALYVGAYERINDAFDVFYSRIYLHFDALVADVKGSSAAAPCNLVSPAAGTAAPTSPAGVAATGRSWVEDEGSVTPPSGVQGRCEAHRLDDTTFAGLCRLDSGGGGGCEEGSELSGAFTVVNTSMVLNHTVVAAALHGSKRGASSGNTSRSHHCSSQSPGGATGLTNTHNTASGGGGGGVGGGFGGSGGAASTSEGPCTSLIRANVINNGILLRELCLFISVLPNAFAQLSALSKEEHARLDRTFGDFVLVLKTFVQLLMASEN